MVSLLRDLRQAARGLLKAPALTVTAVALLALGIGATASIFSLSYAVLLKPLPVPNPDELYRVGTEPRCCYSGGYSQEGEFSLVSYELYEHFRDNVRGFANLAAFQAYAGVFGVRSPATDKPVS